MCETSHEPKFVAENHEGVASLPQTHTCYSLYLCNLIVKTFDISNVDDLMQQYLRSYTLGCTDIEIRKSEFVAKAKDSIP